MPRVHSVQFMFYGKTEQKVSDSLIVAGVLNLMHALFCDTTAYNKKTAKRQRTMYLNCNGCGKLEKHF